MNSEKYTLTKGGILVETRLAENLDEPYQLFLDATAVGRAGDGYEQEKRTTKILELLEESNIGNSHSDGEAERDLSIQIGTQRMGYGVFGMGAQFLRPAVSDEEASARATNAMRQMARDLGYNKGMDLRGMVYASVSREYGITLETNPAASSSMDTDGQHYRPDSEMIELHAHNLYTSQMQLICISGIIALAKAR